MSNKKFTVTRDELIQLFKLWEDHQDPFKETYGILSVPKDDEEMRADIFIMVLRKIQPNG